ncbi:penicilin amidase [Haloprofundus marisrubri]|uniref:Penicilin amidase n=1 Tax=Haloprofundus marisrubri TaxID=1514971 RepID=A0A0W1R9T6_9EURY|nr:penicillin acylase family protein [Haloprofundus marisrubri]KTG10107.1 penicilin amidase [Haloprofundus marisrubri]
MHSEPWRVALSVVLVGALVASAALGGTFLSLAAPFSGDAYEGVDGGVGDGERIENPYGEATVTYDEYGVPHVDAENEEALYFAVGYVQARDRLFAMDLQRRLIAGELSSAVGERAVESDEFYRSLDFEGAAEASWESVRDTEAGPGVEAFSAGVNHYTDTQPLPPEFGMLGYEPDEWTPVDTLLIGKQISWTLSGNFADLRRETVQSRLGDDAAAELYPDALDHDSPNIRGGSDAEPYTPDGDISESVGGDAPVDGDAPVVGDDSSAAIGDDSQTAQSADFEGLYDWVQAYETDPGVGSNNWVVSGDLTESGSPLLANDPHLQLTVPALWYEMHLTTDEMNVRGVTFPGIPFAIIGQTDDVAWGVTNVGGDFTDQYTYETRDGEYLYDGEYRPFETTNETIEVADGEDRTITVRKTVHGPVIEREGTEVAVAWPGFSATNESLGVYQLNHAAEMSDVREALEIWDVPAQNIVAMDRSGETLYYPAGKYPIRRTGDEVVRGDQVFNGSANEGEWAGYEPYGQSSWDGFAPFDAIPHLDNPEYAATANQRVVDDPQFYVGTSMTFADPYRGERIYELLDERAESGTPMTPEDMKEIQRDVDSDRADAFTAYALSSTNASTGLSSAAREDAETLRGWNGSMRADSEAALVYTLWMEEFRNATFADEFGAQGLDEGYYPRDYVLQGFDEESDWYDDSRTQTVETRADIAAVAMNRTAERIDASGYETYGDYNRLDLNHPFGQAFLDFPERAMDGSPYTVFNFRTESQVGSSLRMVVSFENDSSMILPGGNSGNPWSPQYDDQLDMWADGEYRRMTLDSPGGDPDLVFVAEESS